MADEKSEDIFARLYRELGEIGRHRQQQELVEYRAAAAHEAIFAKAEADVKAGLELAAAARALPDLKEPAPPAQSPALQAGAPEGEQAVVAVAGQAGLPAESEQPKSPVP